MIDYSTGPQLEPVQRDEPIPVEEWEWFGLPGHFIMAHKCVFHLCTKVGPWLVSTVGRMEHEAYDGDVEEIGAGRTHETMVFLAGERCDTEDCGCGMPTIDGAELDVSAYNSDAEAQEGHHKMCRKWAEKALKLYRPEGAGERLYVVVEGVGPDARFVEIENAVGESVSVPRRPAEGEGLSRIGPLYREPEIGGYGE